MRAPFPMQHDTMTTGRQANRCIRIPSPFRRATRAGMLAWICLASTAFALIPEETAILQHEEILKAVEKARESSSAEVDRQSERIRAERNRQIQEEMSQPPVDFAHFNRPRNPAARRQANRRIQQSSPGTSEKADIPGKKPFLSPVPSIIGLTLFAGVLVLHTVLSRRRNSSDKPTTPEATP